MASLHRREQRRCRALPRWPAREWGHLIREPPGSPSRVTIGTLPGGSAGVIPTNEGETLVFVATRQRHCATPLRPCGVYQLVRETSPALAGDLRQGAAGTFRGFAGHPGVLRPAWGPGWALVGDAGYFKDPITAHGITDALRDARVLARAVMTGTDAALPSYQTVRDDLSVPLFTITDEIASYAWDIPRLQALHKSLARDGARSGAHRHSGFRFACGLQLRVTSTDTAGQLTADLAG